MAARLIRPLGLPAALALLLCLAVLTGDGRTAGRREGRVAAVVDGDTFRLNDDERVRLLGIDTPERGDTLYREATEALASLVLERDVALEFGRRRRDSYKRLLAHVWIGDTLVNEWMLRRGLARLYMWPPDTLYFGRLLAAQSEARRAGRGVWGVPPPRPEPFYVIHPQRLRFHRPGCMRSSSKVQKREMTREQLLYLGYSPCRNCKP